MNIPTWPLVIGCAVLYLALGVMQAFVRSYFAGSSSGSTRKVKMDDAEKEKIRAAFAYMGPQTQAGLTLEALAKGAGILIKDLRIGNAAQADRLREALLQNEEMKKAVEKLSRAPTWHLSVENCNRKALEDFMERYCLWYNDVTKTEKRKDAIVEPSEHAGISCSICKSPAPPFDPCPKCGSPGIQK